MSIDATTEDRIWVDASIEVTPSVELESVALAANREECSDRDVTVLYSNVLASWNPWSGGPVGGIGHQTCNGGGTDGAVDAFLP